MYQVSGFWCQEGESLNPETLYETRPKWHNFFFDLTGLFLAGGWAEH